MVKCSMYYSLDVATNGDQNNSWSGFGQVQSQLSEITAKLDSAKTVVNNNLNGNTWILTDYYALENTNLDLWNKNHNSVVYSPNPTSTNTAMTAGTALPTIVPRFIQSGLGPNGTANTMVTDIDSGLKVTKGVR